MEEMKLKELFAGMTEEEIKSWLKEFGAGWTVGEMKSVFAIVFIQAVIIGAETCYIADKLIEKWKKKRKEKK